MAITKLSDVIVPELFNPYVVNRTMELSALFNSGIVTNNQEFNKLASEAAPIHNMPFFHVPPQVYGAFFFPVSSVGNRILLCVCHGGFKSVEDKSE